MYVMQTSRVLATGSRLTDPIPELNYWPQHIPKPPETCSALLQQHQVSVNVQAQQASPKADFLNPARRLSSAVPELDCRCLQTPKPLEVAQLLRTATTGVYECPGTAGKPNGRFPGSRS